MEMTFALMLYLTCNTIILMITVIRLERIIRTDRIVMDGIITSEHNIIGSLIEEIEQDRKFITELRRDGIGEVSE